MRVSSKMGSYRYEFGSFSNFKRRKRVQIFILSVAAARKIKKQVTISSKLVENTNFCITYHIFS